MKTPFENFERAFDAGIGSELVVCKCGRSFACQESGKASEIEGATVLDYAPGLIDFGTGQYCNACDCWHEGAKKLVAWLTRSRHQIAAFYALEAGRLRSLADSMPIILPLPPSE